MQQEWFIPAGGDPAETLVFRDHGENYEAVDQLNTLLRGEISANEMYRMAIEKMIADEMGAAHVAVLRESQHEHLHSAEALRKRIVALGGTCESSSGAWGAWARVAQGTAQLFGDRAALHSLKDSEQLTLKHLRENTGSLDAESLDLLEQHLLPAQERNLERVNYLIELMSVM